MSPLLPDHSTGPASLVTSAPTSLRARLIRSMAGMVFVVAGVMLVTVAGIQYLAARKSLDTMEAKIRESIVRKGNGLAANHALALRGLVADNAFGDVGRLVGQAVKEDPEVIYGLFLGADRRPWAYVSPNKREAKDANLSAWTELGLDPATAKKAGQLSARRELFDQEIFEFSASVDGEDGEPMGRIYYGISGQPLAQALSQARSDSWRSLGFTALLLLLVGLGGSGLGLLISAKASSRITKPIAELTAATESFAAGKRDARVAVQSTDEVGSLGRAFNQMVGELNDSYHRLEGLNRTLEQRVADRTQALAERNRDMRLVLDNVDQGFLTITSDGVLATERSAIVDKWFGSFAAKTRFSDYLAAHDRVFSESFELGFEALLMGMLPVELSVDQLPKKLQANGRRFSCTYFPIGEGEDVRGLLIVIDDITDELLRARHGAEQRELVEIFQGISRDRVGFLAFFDEATRLLEQLNVTDVNGAADRKRALHTLKGNASLAGLAVVADLCHRAEDLLAENDDAQLSVTLAELRSRWLTLTQALSAFLGERGREALEVKQHELDRVIDEVRRGAAAPRILAALTSWKLEPSERPLTRLGNYGRSVAGRLGKGDILVEVDGRGVRLDPKRWTPLWSDLVHVVRNAVDHGLDTPDERRRANKLAPPRLRLTTAVNAGRFVVEIEDDGRGIDWDAVRAAAVRKGLQATTPEHLTQALFAEEVTTSKEVSQFSGRGVGLAAVQRTVNELGGIITVESRKGQGTTFRFTFGAGASDFKESVVITRADPYS